MELTQHRVDWKALFAQRGFRYFFAGLFISLIGSGMNFAGVTWYILGRTGSTVQVSLLLILLTAPGLIVPFVGGVLIDRLDRRYLGVTLDLARAVIIGGVSALFLSGRGGPAQIYEMEVCLGIASAVYWSNANALVQEIIPAGQLVTANSAALIAIQGGLAIAGGFVGFVYDHAGIGGILAIDALSYIGSAFCLLLLRRGHFPPQAHHWDELPVQLEAPLASAEETALPPLIEPMPETEPTARFFADLREGAAYLRERPGVLAIGLTYACMIAGVMSANVLVVALAKDLLHAGAPGYGAMETGWAVGAIAGGLAAGALARRFTVPAVLLAAMWTLSVGHALFPYAGFLAAGVFAMGVFGGCRAIGGILTQSSLMAMVPRRLMGRTQSAFSMISTVLQLAMSFSLGWLADRISLPVAFLVLGLLYGIAVVAAWRARELTRPTAQPA